MSIYTAFKQWFIRRPVYSPGNDNFFREHAGLLLFSMICFVAVVLFRSWPNYVTPGLYVEDNGHYFNHFYGNTRHFADILRSPNGYNQIFTNFTAYLVAFLDVRIQPTVYLWLATVIAVITCMVVPASGLLKNKYIIFIAPFLLGLSGLNHLFYFITLTYQIYVLVIFLVSMLFWRVRDNIIANFCLFMVLSLFIWSGPYSVLVVPFSFWFILFFRGKTWLLLGLCVVTILYTMAVSEHMIIFRNLFKVEIWRIWISLLVDKVFFFGLKGALGPKKVAITILFFATILAVFRKDTFYLKIIFLLLVLINGTLFALLLSKKFLLALRVLPCYLVIAQYFWLVLLLFTIDRFLSLHKYFYHGGILACALVVAFIVYDNGKEPSKGMVDTMPSLAAYLQMVHALEQQQETLIQENKRVIVSLGGKPFRPTVAIGAKPGPDVKTELKQMQ